MTWILLIWISLPGGDHKTWGWAEYSNKAACEYAGKKLKLPKQDHWQCLEQST
jgi:hypothetical protein